MMVGRLLAEEELLCCEDDKLSYVLCSCGQCISYGSRYEIDLL